MTDDEIREDHVKGDVIDGQMAELEPEWRQSKQICPCCYVRLWEGDQPDGDSDFITIYKCPNCGYTQ